MNFRNAYRKGDDQTPLQLLYLAVDCHLFYTWKNYVNQESVCIAAAKAMFGKRACVQGLSKETRSLIPKSKLSYVMISLLTASVDYITTLYRFTSVQPFP